MKNVFKKVLVLILTLVLALNVPIDYHVTKLVNTKAAALTTTRASVHDPSIVQANGQYYIFGTHMVNAVSNNLTQWSSFTSNVNTNYSTLFSVGRNWAVQGGSGYDLASNLWAPDVIYNPTMKKWCMYMSVNGANFYSSIALATADTINGPYTYQGTIVYSGFVNSTQAANTDYSRVTGSNSVASRYLSNGSWNSSYSPNAIDPCLIYDKNGDLWMSYGSWFGGIFMLKLNKNTGLRDYSTTYSTTTNISDQYFGTRISGGYGLTGEGSYIVYDASAGYYYLYMSYNGLNATDNFAGYHIRLFRSTNITGPYIDAAGNTAICTSSSANQSNKGIKLFGNYDLSSLSGNGEYSSNGYMSPGHNSAFVDTNGRRYLVYHTRFNTGNEFHQVRVHEQFLNQDKWPVTAVYEHLGSTISQTGYSTNDMIGTYDIVNHGLAAATTYTGMLPTGSVTLNSNGTITGSYSGTWTSVSGTYYCTMVIGGVTYKGIFFKQYDESASKKETMTFSLIGTNNQSIWGSKTADAASISGNSTPGLNGTYYIKSKLSSLYLDVVNGSAADGTNIQQYAYNGSDAQKFKLVSDGNGYYSILTGASNYTSCVDIENGANTDGANVLQWTHWGGDMQKYEIIQVSAGTYAIKTKASGSTKALDVYNMSTANGANINQWSYWGGDAQLWNLENASSSTGTNRNWNFSSSAFSSLSKISSNTSINYLTLLASSSKTMSLISGSVNVSGTTYSKYLALGGFGTTASRSVKFDVTGACSIKVVLKSSGSTARTLNVLNSSGSVIGTITAPASVGAVTYNYTGGSQSIYLASSNSGINIWDITVTY